MMLTFLATATDAQKAFEEDKPWVILYSIALLLLCAVLIKRAMPAKTTEQDKKQ